jgi:hypothetical protein
VTIISGGNTAYTQNSLAHTHHARWHRVVWTGLTRPIHVKHDIDYLIETKAVPNYDRSLTVSASALNSLDTLFDPMDNGGLTSYMPTTGAHSDIGPLPRFAALYLLTMDWQAKMNTLANGGCGGSYQIHYRDKGTDLPISMDDYPRMTLLGNPIDCRDQCFPAVSNGLTQHTPDGAHQPSIGYLPYLVSGDLFFLDELQFWANYNMIRANPNYRGFEQGLLKWGQVRDQGWSLRTLGHTAYITPDIHPLKSYFEEKLNYNIEWYDSAYAQNPNACKLGFIVKGDERPWMDDFVTWAAGCLVELDYTKALPFLLYKATYPVGRMTDPFCWLHAPMYTSIGKDGNGDYFTNFKDYYDANFTDQACSGLQMGGSPSSATGYGANMQPGLAICVDARKTGAAEAWTKYETRDPKQDYTGSPQFAVVPRPNDSLTVVETKPTVPDASPVLVNVPNPFYSNTIIRVQRTQNTGDRRQNIKLKIFNIKGEQVTILSPVFCVLHSGITWNASKYPSGLYLCRLTMGNRVLERKMILLK